MNNWNKWEIGDKIKWKWEEWDGKGSMIGILVEKEADHAIVKANNMNLWLDNDTSDMFEKI